MTSFNISLDELIASHIQKNGGKTDGQNGLSNAMKARRMLDHYLDLEQRYPFKKGDLVQLKEGLPGHLRVPQPGEPAIITGFLDPPITDPDADHGDTSFGQTFDVRVLVFTENDRVLEFAYDSRFLMPYQGEIEQ